MDTLELDMDPMLQEGDHSTNTMSVTQDAYSVVDAT